VRRHAPVARPPAPGEVRLSVVVPAFHEVDAIGATVDRIRRELAGVAAAGGLEVVVVDDGSDDGTAAAARAAGADRVIELHPNRGKGAAVRAGMLAAAGRTIAFTDADLSYAPAQLERFLAAIEDGWDVAVGNRYHRDSTTLAAAGTLRRLGGRAVNLATRAVLREGCADTQCGIKAFRSDVARILFGHSHVDGFAFDVELFHLAERYRLAVVELPVEVANSDSSTVRVARDAMVLLADLARIRRDAFGGAYELDPHERELLEVVEPVADGS
jgi:glycosyltransferase involved in cell wall biosynthesis